MTFKDRFKQILRLADPTQFPSNFPANISQLPASPDWRSGYNLTPTGPYGSITAPNQIDPAHDQGQPKVVVVHENRVGSSGTISFSGYPAEDYLHEMHGKNKAKIYDHMRRSDAQIKKCLNAVKNPIRSATWSIEPAGDEFMPTTPEEEMHSEAVDYILFKNMDRPFGKVINEALTMVEFGHSVFEITNKIVTGDPKWNNFIGIKDIGWRSPKTIERWNLDPNTDRLSSILQLAWGDTSRFVEIPGEFLLVFSIDREGSNYEGISMLRPCYGPWRRKELYLKLNAIGVEKFAIPTPTAEIPDGKQNSEQYRNLVEALRTYAEHEQAYLTFPQGWKVVLNNNTYDPAKVETSIDRESMRMVDAFLANFLELGKPEMGGNRALSEDLSTFFLSGIQFMADEICDEINLTLIPAIVKQNFGPQPRYPKLKASGIADKAGEALSRLLKNLADSQIIVPDDDLEVHMRKRLGLPPMSQEGQRKVLAKGGEGQGAANVPVEHQASESKILRRIRLAEEARLESLALDELDAKKRNKLKDSSFVFPKDRRYPIHDISHARNALARSSGTKDEAAVKRAVYSKYPELKPEPGK